MREIESLLPKCLLSSQEITNPILSTIVAHVERYIVPETKGPHEIACGLPASEEDYWARMELVAERYLKEGYIRLEDANLIIEKRKGIQRCFYYDPYEPYSLPLIAKQDGVVVASLRLTLNIPEIGLPIHHALESGEVIIDSDKDQKWLTTAPIEITQLAKRAACGDSSTPCDDIRSPLALYGFYLRLGIPAAGIIDTRALKRMNGRSLNFNIPVIGREGMYMGSSCVPIRIIPKDVLESSKNGRLHPNLHQYLSTGSASGFEWYVGR